MIWLDMFGDTSMDLCVNPLIMPPHCLGYIFFQRTKPLVDRPIIAQEQLRMS